jgi:Cu(I)/Ag(I) efflux system membrane protein CusA/SilA
MNAALQIPGLSNLWVQPIRNRIDMLSTGIKSPVGIKIAGPDLQVIEKLGEQIEATVKAVPGTRSAYAERVQGGRYIEVRIDRVRAARFGLSLAPRCESGVVHRRRRHRRRRRAWLSPRLR